LTSSLGPRYPSDADGRTVPGVHPRTIRASPRRYAPEASASGGVPPRAAVAETEIPVPFAQANLTNLIQTGAFNLWHYRTTDTRATVSAAGYFATVAANLKPGDLMILQASDAMALLPIRTSAVLGTGVTLDGPVGPLRLTATTAPRFSFRQVASVVVRTIVLAPFAAGIVAGGTIPVSATVVGPISQVVFSLRDANGTIVPPVKLVSVVSGMATASFATPPVGSGYRIRVEDATDPTLAALSQTFNVSADLRLVLVEAGGHMLTESGSALKQ